jgi:hypothetical protein
MPFFKKNFERELDSIFRRGKRRFGKFDFGIIDESPNRSTVHDIRGPVIQFGTAQLDDVVSFGDYVSCIVDAFHEMQHCKQHWDVRRDKQVGIMAIDLYADTDSKEYYFGTYNQHYSEYDAEIVGLEAAREYLHRKYPMYKQEIDHHLLNAAQIWFSGVAPEVVNYTTETLEDALKNAKVYRDSLLKYQEPFAYDDVQKSDDLIAKYLFEHQKSGRETYLDDAFLTAGNGLIQRYAAFDITAQVRRDELMRLVPALEHYESPIARLYRDVPAVQLSDSCSKDDFCL